MFKLKNVYLFIIVIVKIILKKKLFFRLVFAGYVGFVENAHIDKKKLLEAKHTIRSIYKSNIHLHKKNSESPLQYFSILLNYSSLDVKCMNVMFVCKILFYCTYFIRF